MNDLREAGLLREILHDGAGPAEAIELRALAPPMEEPLPAELLALAADPSRHVRQALVDLLARRPHPEHKASLLRLLEQRGRRGVAERLVRLLHEEHRASGLLDLPPGRALPSGALDNLGSVRLP